MHSLSKLINHLKDLGILHSPEIISAFEKIDRKDFVTHDSEDIAYEDIPLAIGKGQSISQPFAVAFMFELLNPQKGEKILDVGSGSGYTTTLLSEIAGESGQVIGVEIIPELVNFGRSNLAKYNFPKTEIREAGNGLGLPKEAPFDKILVSASAKSIPKQLLKQLKIGGIMVIPIKNSVLKIRKDNDGNPRIERYKKFVFVPLTRKKIQIPSMIKIFSSSLITFTVFFK